MTKKSVEISGLPVISITEGRELGVSKTLVIDARRGAVAAITIEDEDWYRGVKLLPYTSVIAIGRDALTVTSSESILTLEEASDFEAMLDANVRILGTKAITKTGTINGKVTEIYIDDDGVVEKVQITRPDGSDFEIVSDEISIFGKQVTVIGDPGDGEDRKHIVEEYNVAPPPPPAPEPEPEPVPEPEPAPEPTPVPEPVIAPEPEPEPEPEPVIAPEPMAITPEPIIAAAPEIVPEPEPMAAEPIAEPEPAPVTEPEITEPAEPEIAPELVSAFTAEPAPEPEPEEPLVLEPTPEPEFTAEEPEPAPEPEEEPKPKKKTSTRSKKAAAPEPPEELTLDLETEPEPKKKASTKTKKATTSKTKKSTATKTKKSADAAPKKPEDADKAVMDRHRRFLIGKKAARDIMAGSSAIIVKAGDPITEEVLQKAQLAGKLIELSMNAQ